MRSILVVDDEEQVRFVVRASLEKRYEISEAADGREAIEILRRDDYDLVITDILMPERDGLETIHFLREQQPDVKVIAISAPTNKPYLECARTFGAQRILTKPLRIRELEDAVAELLGE